MLHLHQGLELLEQGLIVCLLVLLGVLHQELRHQSHENSTHTGSGDATRPGHVADDYNPQVPPQADPAPGPDGEDVTLDSDL